MKIECLAFTSFLLLGACSEESEKVIDMRDASTIEQTINEDAADDESATTSDAQSTESSTWSYKVYLVSEGNWGYQLFDGATMVINQPSIPAVQGIAGFDTKEKADKTARFVLEKMKRGEIPPTISREELERLNVLRAEN